MKRKDQSKSKKQPTYSLQECKKLTNEGKINIPIRVQRDIKDIGNNVPYIFTRKTLIKFINSLTETDFSKSILYDENSPWFDVYIKKHEFYFFNNYQEEEQETLILYFKYFIREEELMVQVVSFHPER